jgi:hypothetical protein
MIMHRYGSDAGNRKCGVHNQLSDRFYLSYGSEERGLLVLAILLAIPILSSIAAVLNGDMIGRNAPDSVALLGVTEPSS